jgi:anti-sigma factor RsiW
MNSKHLSAWEQEEYVIGSVTEQKAPELFRHLAQCAECRSAVEKLEQDLAGFRTAAIQLSSQTLAERPQRRLAIPSGRPLPQLRWAFAALLPLLLLILVLLPFRSSTPSRPAAHINDDALMDQVDEQVSEAVPSSMESLTHLVSSGGESTASASGVRSKQLVQDN